MTDRFDSAFLEELGLGPSEAKLYRTLLLRGPLRASALAKASALTRTNTYNVLAQLERRQLVERRGGGRQTVFAPRHPSALTQLLDAQEAALRRNRAQLEEQMQHLVVDFSLAEGREGVFRFEGRNGLVRVYEALIGDRVTVNSIVDRRLLRSVIADYNPEYVRKRQRYRIHSRVITPAARPLLENSERELREVRYLDAKSFPFGMDLKITSKKVVMTTLAEESIVGIIIVDREVIRNFTVLFEFLWQSASPAPP